MFLLDIAKARQVPFRYATPAGLHAQPSQCFLLEPVLSFSMASPAVSTARKFNGWSIMPPDLQFRCSVSRERRSNGEKSGGGSEWTHPLCYRAKPEGWNLIHHSRHGSHWTRMTFGSGVGLLSHLGLPQCSPVVKSWRSLFLPCGRCRLSEGLVVRQQRGTTWKEFEADPLSLWWEPRWSRVQGVCRDNHDYGRSWQSCKTLASTELLSSPFRFNWTRLNLLTNWQTSCIWTYI